LAMQIDSKELEKLLRKFFRAKDQVKHVLGFIETLHAHICSHSPRSDITIEQPNTRNQGSYFLPGEFEIVINKLGAELVVETYPLPDNFAGILFINRKVCFSGGQLCLKYIFRLSLPVRNSISVKPKNHRDSSPQRKPSKSSSLSSPSSSPSSSLSESPKKKKKQGFFASFGL